ncbi:hypothetical protein LBMAG27_02600 [Bacteroidota bacterium]|nr:hypothetical protein LBMAG27_02600 [Bacteroidota bacterium]
MKHDNHKKLAGVWLDHKEALILTTDDHKNHGEFAIREKVQEVHHSTSGGEHRQHNSEKGITHHYFNAVSDKLKEYDEILLIGPGTAQEELKNMMSADHQFSNKKISIESAEHLSENQLVARITNHFQLKMHIH